MKKVVKSIVGKRLYKKCVNIRYEARLKQELNQTVSFIQKHRSKKNIFLFLTPIHANIGDLAIAEAEVLFLKKYFSEYNIIEISHPLSYRFTIKARQYIRSTDLIMLHGGGNLGNHYIHEEHARRMMLESFPNNQIISFPQTVYYTDNEVGQKELEISQHIIKKHPNLTLIAREKTSYDLMQQYFPTTEVLLTPDIVLSMDETKPTGKRDGVMMVLRTDGEKRLNTGEHQELDRLVRKFFGKVTYSDMIYHKEVNNQQRYSEVLTSKFNEFKSYQLVITDRLHGMVFAAITGTPCIALANYNHKVSGTYAWIRNLDYVRYVEGLDNLEATIQELSALMGYTMYNSVELNDYYKLIVDKIKNALV